MAIVSESALTAEETVGCVKAQRFAGGLDDAARRRLGLALIA
jgi:hypothetical protein